MLSCCFLDFSVGVGAFVIGLSQISCLFSHCKGKYWHQHTSDGITCNISLSVLML